MVIPEELTPATPNKALDGVKEVVAQYSEIANAAIGDAQRWLRDGALSRAIPEAIPDAIMVTDESGLIISVNSRFELMFGYHRSEVIGQMPEMLLPECVQAQHVQHRRSYHNDPKLRDMGVRKEFQGRRKNGDEFPVLVKLGPVVIPAGIHTIVVIRSARD